MDDTVERKPDEKLYHGDAYSLYLHYFPVAEGILSSRKESNIRV